MNIIGIPTERTTALTDLIMGILVLGVIIFLQRQRRSSNSTKLSIWLAAFVFLGIASFVGTIAHGFEMSPDLNYWLWQPLNLALGLAIAMFVVAVSYDIWGGSVYRRVFWIMIVVALVFYAITVIIPGTFMTFVGYEALAMLFALVGYIFLAIKKRLDGAWWMVTGILITIIAAAIQAVGKSGLIIFWGLDHNGVFHVVQMLGVLALTAGLQKSFLKLDRKN